MESSICKSSIPLNEQIIEPLNLLTDSISMKPNMVSNDNYLLNSQFYPVQANIEQQQQEVQTILFVDSMLSLPNPLINNYSSLEIMNNLTNQNEIDSNTIHNFNYIQLYESYTCMENSEELNYPMVSSWVKISINVFNVNELQIITHFNNQFQIQEPNYQSNDFASSFFHQDLLNNGDNLLDFELLPLNELIYLNDIAGNNNFKVNEYHQTSELQELAHCNDNLANLELSPVNASQQIYFNQNIVENNTFNVNEYYQTDQFDINFLSEMPEESIISEAFNQQELNSNDNLTNIETSPLNASQRVDFTNIPMYSDKVKWLNYLIYSYIYPYFTF